MPGSGKSTWGRKLAASLRLPFIDLDRIIEMHLGQSIAGVFQAKGEDYFRETERELLLKAIHHHRDFVMATGGGAPCFFDNLQQMKQAGTTIFLDVPFAEIIRRMSKKGRAARPLLAGMDQDNLEADFTDRFRHRLAFYQQAHHILGEDNLNVSSVISLIKT